MKDVFLRRFVELEKAFDNLPLRMSSSSSSSSLQHYEEGDWKKWATSAQNLILAVYGEHSPQYQNFFKEYEDCGGYEYEVYVLKGIFLSAKEDFEGGYVFDVELRISGEVFGDFISLAKQSLSEGYKDVAAVLACAALEDVLKRYAEINNIEIGNKTLHEIINALKAEGLVSGPQKSILESMPRVRNAAMHADWDKITAPDVSSVIGFVEQFLLTKFSG
jgi:hypothetical protein